MGVHIASSLILFVFGVLMMVVGAVFIKTSKGYSGAVQGVVLGLGSLMILGASGWFWWALEN